ncbi:MAG: hypothetical protein KGZ70_03935 [Hydrogenophaga sp.]|uniref:hypothetical protein n=1 Tax=Hydrogenophaga sp. TaxID=1904254 RepID=UPI001BBE96AD|nr:hypothetical protein [Hydrogenophaga sp.]MBS3910974.1 hypothetical protein [Hydrogenophaga sp.]MDO9149458.1 hypothetical protein [Hydrogenophaga sp.]MDO9606853.1 hypothetical protein [Hydrogenophaga sp.]MDP2166327.1 hypothetical protein [Hydrogenophaga sp.]MDP3475791.1 hypothetical protein [Hydrogenophaga sp.]
MNDFIARRWHGHINWPTLFWRDLLLIGTGLNVLMTGTALVLLSQNVSTPWVLLAHLSPLPYNLLIVRAIWRAPQRPAPVLIVSVSWVLLFVAI